MQLYSRNEGNTVFTISFSTVLLIAAIVLFVLQALGVGDNDTVHLGWVGLACFAGAFLVP